MYLAEMRDLIRAEAGVEGLKSYTTLIDSIINQEYQRLTGKSKYVQLYTTATLTPLVDESHTFDLPTDFQHWAAVRYFYPLTDPDGVELYAGLPGRDGEITEGYPKYFYRNALSILFYPYGGILIGDSFILEYYKKQTLSVETDEMLIPSLETVVMQFAMARMLRMTDTKKAMLVKRDAEQAYLDTRAENAG